ncbi:hypothetical protein Tco_0571307 [Tanacetum coccineum]
MAPEKTNESLDSCLRWQNYQVRFSRLLVLGGFPQEKVIQLLAARLKVNPHMQRRLIAADQASVFMAMTSVHISSGLVLHQMTSDHNRSELGIQDHSNEQSSSKLVPKVVP